MWTCSTPNASPALLPGSPNASVAIVPWQSLIYLGCYADPMTYAQRARAIFERHGDRFRLARLDSNPTFAVEADFTRNSGGSLR